MSEPTCAPVPVGGVSSWTWGSGVLIRIGLPGGEACAASPFPPSSSEGSVSGIVVIPVDDGGVSTVYGGGDSGMVVICLVASSVSILTVVEVSDSAGLLAGGESPLDSLFLGLFGVSFGPFRTTTPSSGAGLVVGMFAGRGCW